MKEDLSQSAPIIKKIRKIHFKCSSNPKTISFSCSKCDKTLSYEDTYLVNTGDKVKTWRSEDAALLAFYCEACLSAKNG